MKIFCEKIFSMNVYNMRNSRFMVVCIIHTYQLPFPEFLGPDCVGSRG